VAADDIARKLLGADVVNRDGIKVRDLPGPLQQIMLDSANRPVDTALWLDEDGMSACSCLCGRDAPEAATQESFDDVMSRLGG
jgi:peptidyl-prolyl cis-trans isomerase SurA